MGGLACRCCWRRPSAWVRGQAWAETGSQATSTRDEPIRCSIVLGPEAPDLEVFAAHELSRYLRELYGIQSELVRTLGAGSGLSILLGSPQTNPAFHSISAHHAWPRVSDQGVVLKRVSGADREVLILGGGSPAATLWAVYELVERSGVRFLLEKDVFPEVAEPFPPRQLDLVREPRFRFRSYRAINNLATSLIFYGMKDYRYLIDQLAKMKFNVLYAQIYPHQPFVHYQMRGQPKVTGVLHYGWKVPIHAETIGRELFGGRSQLVNPELAGAATYRERVRAAQGLLHELFAYARCRGMQTGLNFRINQFTNEFNWKLAQWSDRKYIPEEAMKGARNARLGISEYAVDPQAFPYMTPDNPAVMELNKTIIRAHVNTYPEADFYGLTQPELPGGGERYREMWDRLDRKYRLEPEFSLDRMLESAKANTLPVGVRRGTRPVEELKGALANADTLDKLLNEGGILRETANPEATVVVSTFSDEFYPVMPRIFPGRVMLMVPMDYLTSLAAERTEMLAFAEHSPMKVGVLATLADDNIGILPQLPTQPLHRIFQAMERYNVFGYFGRQFLVTKLEAGTAYMAQASWSSGVTPESVYRDQVRQVCGEGAVSDMLDAYRILEESHPHRRPGGHGIPLPGHHHDAQALAFRFGTQPGMGRIAGSLSQGGAAGGIGAAKESPPGQELRAAAIGTVAFRHRLHRRRSGSAPGQAVLPAIQESAGRQGRPGLRKSHERDQSPAGDGPGPAEVGHPALGRGGPGSLRPGSPGRPQHLLLRLSQGRGPGRLPGVGNLEHSVLGRRTSCRPSEWPEFK